MSQTISAILCAVLAALCLNLWHTIGEMQESLSELEGASERYCLPVPQKPYMYRRYSNV